MGNNLKSLYISLLFIKLLTDKMAFMIMKFMYKAIYEIT